MSKTNGLTAVQEQRLYDLCMHAGETVQAALDILRSGYIDENKRTPFIDARLQNLSACIGRLHADAQNLQDNCELDEFTVGRARADRLLVIHDTSDA